MEHSVVVEIKNGRHTQGWLPGRELPGIADTCQGGSYTTTSIILRLKQ